jgi:hypothetical protein
VDIDTAIDFTHVGSLETDPAAAATARRVVDDVLDEHAHRD